MAQPSKRLLAVMDDDEKKKVMSKSAAAKKAKSGADMGKPGKNFKKIENKATREYGSRSAGQRVAGSIFQKMRKIGKL